MYYTYESHHKIMTKAGKVTADIPGRVQNALHSSSLYLSVSSFSSYRSSVTQLLHNTLWYKCNRACACSRCVFPICILLSIVNFWQLKYFPHISEYFRNGILLADSLSFQYSQVNFIARREEIILLINVCKLHTYTCVYIYKNIKFIEIPQPLIITPLPLYLSSFNHCI